MNRQHDLAVWPFDHFREHTDRSDFRRLRGRGANRRRDESEGDDNRPGDPVSTIPHPLPSQKARRPGRIGRTPCTNTPRRELVGDSSPVLPHISSRSERGPARAKLAPVLIISARDGCRRCRDERFSPYLYSSLESYGFRDSVPPYRANCSGTTPGRPGFRKGTNERRKRDCSRTGSREGTGPTCIGRRSHGSRRYTVEIRHRGRVRSRYGPRVRVAGQVPAPASQIPSDATNVIVTDVTHGSSVP